MKHDSLEQPSHLLEVPTVLSDSTGPEFPAPPRRWKTPFDIELEDSGITLTGRTIVLMLQEGALRILNSPELAVLLAASREFTGDFTNDEMGGCVMCGAGTLYDQMGDGPHPHDPGCETVVLRKSLKDFEEMYGRI